MNQGFIDTTLEDTALTAIAAGTPPFTGTYKPQQSFQSLIHPTG